MADTRYNRFDNQSPVETQLRADDVSVPRSAHDCSFIQNGTALIGALFPLKPIWYVPNEDFDISLSAVFEFRNPTVRQLYNGFRVFFNVYRQDITDLWEGARNWIDHGRRGTLNLDRPNLIYRALTTEEDIIADSSSPLSLMSYFGIPSTCFQLDYANVENGLPPLRWFQCVQDDNSAGYYTAQSYARGYEFLPADLFFMYQKIWRDYYCNKNLLQNNQFWFPDNEDHFILSYSCTDAVCINYENEDFHQDGAFSSNYQVYNLIGSQGFFDFSRLTPEPNNPTTVPPENYSPPVFAPNLSGLKFRQFRGDRFTTALPFPDLIRGDIPVLAATQDAIQQVALINKNGEYSETYPYINNSFSVSAGADVPLPNSGSNDHRLYNASESTQQFQLARLGVKLGSLGVTQSDLYTLETLTAFRRRMALTNGDFNQSIKTMFGISPQVHDRKAQYVGGFYQDFAMSTVTQTSQSDSSPLGTRAGQGISSGRGSIGHVHTSNFGWIMILCSIVPDVYYTQGLDRQFSLKGSLQLYFPIFNNLPAQAILNKELYISGNSHVDNDVYAWEDRFAEFKSSRNVVCGLMALPVNMARFDTARIMARRFTTTPKLNSLFITMVPENVDMSPFTVTDEPPFDFSISVSVRRVFPGPYAAIEGSLSSPALVRG